MFPQYQFAALCFATERYSGRGLFPLQFTAFLQYLSFVNEVQFLWICWALTLVDSSRIIFWFKISIILYGHSLSHSGFGFAKLLLWPGALFRWALLCCCVWWKSSSILWRKFGLWSFVNNLCTVLTILFQVKTFSSICFKVTKYRRCQRPI